MPSRASVGRVVHDHALVPEFRGRSTAESEVELHKLGLGKVKVFGDQLTTASLTENEMK